MILQQVFVWSCFVILLSAATLNTASDLIRPKRTIQFFLDGLLRGITEQRPIAARTINDHRTSALISLAKLSSTSTPSKNVQLFDGNDDESAIGNSLNFGHEKPSSFLQMAIPSIASASMKIPDNRVLQTNMVKSVETDDQSIQANKNASREEKTPTHTTTMTPNRMPTSTIAPTLIQPTAVTLNQTTTMAPNKTLTTTTMEPIQTVSDHDPFTVEIETTTMEADNSTADSIELTTMDPLASVMIDPKNLLSNVDEVQTKMEKRNAPMKASNLHTTQFFGGPLMVENHQHKPIYLDDCVEINCRKDMNVIQSRISRLAPIISMTLALPAVPTGNIDQHRQNSQPLQNYNVFTLHTAIPIYGFDSKRLSNDIIDPPAV